MRLKINLFVDAIYEYLRVRNLIFGCGENTNRIDAREVAPAGTGLVGEISGRISVQAQIAEECPSIFRVGVIRYLAPNFCSEIVR